MPQRPFTRENWLRAPHNRASFQQVQSLFPTARLRRGEGKPWSLPARLRDLSDITYTGIDGDRHTVASWLDATFTDALVVLKDGALVMETYAAGMDAGGFHLLNSVSKSFLGMLAGILAEDGIVEPDAKLLRYLPEFEGSAFAATTLQQALDMTAAVRFGEDYAKTDDDFWKEAACVGWRPDLLGDASPNLHDFALGLRETESSDGARFHYRTVLTDVAGMALERAAGEPLAQLMERRLWRRLGPEQDAAVVVDAAGFPYFGAGMNACAGDLARFGQMLMQDGVAGDKQVVPAAWVRATREGTDGLRRLFAEGEYGAVMPGAHYTNQVWADGGAGRLTCIGIYGQTILVDGETGVVIVKLSAHPEPLDQALYLETLLGMTAITAAL